MWYKQLFFYLEFFIILFFVGLVWYFSINKLWTHYQEDTFTKTLVTMYVEQDGLINTEIGVCNPLLERNELLSDDGTDKTTIQRGFLYNAIDEIFGNNIFKSVQLNKDEAPLTHDDTLNSDALHINSKNAELIMQLMNTASRKQDLYKVNKATRRLLENFEKMKVWRYSDSIISKYLWKESKIDFSIKSTPYIVVIADENKTCKRNKCILANWQEVKRWETLEHEEVRYFLYVEEINENKVDIYLYNPYKKVNETVTLHIKKEWGEEIERNWMGEITGRKKVLKRIGYKSGTIFRYNGRQNLMQSKNKGLFESIADRNLSYVWNCYSIQFNTQWWQEHLEKLSKEVLDKRLDDQNE